MNCRLVQRRILETEDPARPPTEIETHLASCSACRDWQRRLLQIERHVPWLPVPASPVPADLVSRLGEKSAAETTSWRARVLAIRRSRWLAPASAVAAAALLLIGLTWWAVREPNRTDLATVPKKPGPDLLLQKLIDRDMALAKAKSADDRLDQLAGLAEDLHSATRDLAQEADVKDLRWLADLYRDVIKKGIVLRAKELQDRSRIKQIRDRLNQTSQDAEDLAKEVPAMSEPLTQIAAAAQDGNKALQGLLDKETP